MNNISETIEHINEIENEFISTYIRFPELLKTNPFNPDDFFNEINRDIYKTLNYFIENNIQISVNTVFGEVQKKNPLIIKQIIKAKFENENIISPKNIKNTSLIIKQNKLRMLLYNLVQDSIETLSAPKNEVDEILEQLESNIDDIKTKMIVEGKSFNNLLDGFINKVKGIYSGSISSYLKTGVKVFDQKIAFSENMIILIAGVAKGGKSKLATFIVKKLLENNQNLATQWFTFEDDEDELVSQFIIPYAKVRTDKILGKGNKLSEDELTRVIQATKIVRSFNIDIIDEPMSIGQISSKFSIFCKQNKGKIPILVIDNISLITDKGNDRDDVIMNKISNLRQRTKALIIVIHHFNDDQMSVDREKYGFRPNIKDIKGREAFRRVPHVVLLTNKPSRYPQLKSAYTLEKELLDAMYIIDIAANRRKKEAENSSEISDESNLIHLFANLDFNIFIPISELY